jgi:hypothetical protein
VTKSPYSKGRYGQDFVGRPFAMVRVNVRSVSLPSLPAPTTFRSHSAQRSNASEILVAIAPNAGWLANFG